MRLLRFLLTWLRRLPLRFTLLLVLVMALYLVVLARFVGPDEVEAAVRWLFARIGLPAVVAERPLVQLGAVGVVVLVLLFLGVLVSYNLAALAYRRVRSRPTIRVGAPADPVPGKGSRLDAFQRIGIILAGGGAKGAYQAGALKAIHAFLEEHGALDRVRMIAGTSIGSWNAMFWLADLVKSPPDGGPSAHELWWRSIGIDRIVEFDTYWPLRKNHFLRPSPWQELFRQVFVDTPEVRERMARLFPPHEDGEPPVHFYLTRSNVELGQLEFATNWRGIRDLSRPCLDTSDTDRREPMVKRGLYEVIEGPDVEKALERTGRAVFASMDLPPLFPYMKIHLDRNEWFEDGGVVENVPVRFGTQIEGCDLLFVLPLNASFAEPVNRTSVTRRLFRVMDVRQGVLERSSFKMVYLYNELAVLRDRVATAETTGSGAVAQLQRNAMRREHRPVSVFSIVPEAPLTIGTAEFWKPQEAGEAFDLMYEATKNELAENFERDTDPGWIRMTRVSPLGERSSFDDF